MLAVICVSRFNREGFFDALVFSSVFVVVSLLWWVPNYVMNGSPLATWQYLNVGSRIHPEGSLAWWWGNQDNYDGLSGLVRDYPIAFIENFFKNAVMAVVLTLKGVASHVYISAFLCIAVIFLLAKRWRSSIDFIIFNKAEVVTAVGYILLCT
ncbi:hypothetical protein [Halomonas sp. H10-9-1]|uniref:hypothetical protein n=1 Tax=Halomonas sp. H10-9-1 TaxID=2950871 RepID=UPI0032DEB13E